MTSILDTIVTRGKYTIKTELKRTVNQMPWVYIPLIAVPWDRANIVNSPPLSYANGGDGMSIGEPPMPGFYRQTINSIVMDITWRTIDISKFSEFMIWADLCTPPGNRSIKLHPLIAVNDDEDNFKMIPNNYPEAVNTYLSCYETRTDSDVWGNPIDGLVGANRMRYDSSDIGSVASDIWFPELKTFKCAGHYLKFGFIVDATYGLDTIQEFGVFIR